MVVRKQSLRQVHLFGFVARLLRWWLPWIACNNRNERRERKDSECGGHAEMLCEPPSVVQHPEVVFREDYKPRRLWREQK